METLGTRLKALRQKRKLSQARLASMAGVSQGTIGNIESDVRGYGESIVDIAKALETTPAYLRLETDVEHAGGSNVIPADIGVHRIPLINYVQAGNWSEIADGFHAGEHLLTDLDLSDRAFALEIKGDSMLPEFRPGDRVIIDPAIPPSPGCFVVAKNGGDEATFKKYRLRGIGDSGEEIIELVPLNPDFAPMRSDKIPFKIIGKMVEHRKYYKNK